MLFRRFGLIGYPGGAHAPPSLQPCPSFTSCTPQRPVVFNTAPPPVNTPVCTPNPPLCLYFFANRWQVGPPMVHRPPPLHHASGMPFSSFPCRRPTAPWSPTATPPPPTGPPCLPPYVPVFSTYDGITAQDRNPARQYPQIICHCPRAWSMGRPLLRCPLCSIIYCLASSRRRRDPSLPTC